MQHKRINLTREIEPKFITDGYVPYAVQVIEESERIIMQKGSYVYARYYITALQLEIEVEKIVAKTYKELLDALVKTGGKEKALQLCIVLGDNMKKRGEER